MTMLDRMRRHKSWLKWSLALVCLAFVIFYIPAFLDRGGDGMGADTVASVDGRDITVNEFRDRYLTQLQGYRQAYGGNISEQMLKQLGIGQQILQQMVDEQAALAEARRQGIDVTDGEVAQRIYADPTFQRNGQFVGQAVYVAMLRNARPPMTPETFESDVRRRLTIQKLSAALTSWLTVSDKDVQQEFKRRNEKVKLDLIVFSADKYRPDVKVTDADLQSWFDSHKEQYRVGERRKIKYLLVDVDALRGRTPVTSREVEKFYNDNIELYSTPEQIRASHILFKTDGKNDDEVKAKAEEVLKEAKAGKDFAELAKKYSQDESSAKNGGDLDYFARGKMVPEFDQVAFSLEPGQISDLVKTQFGYHIIKVTDKKPATTKSLDEVRPQITEQLSFEKAQTRAADLASQLEKEISKPADLDKAAQKEGLKVQESGYFTRDEPILGLGPAPAASAEAFQLDAGQVSGALQTSRGYAFITVTGTEPPHTPKFDEVKEKVREDVTREKAREIAREKAAAVEASLKNAPDFAKAAKAAGVEVKSSELLPRESPWPEVGVSSKIDDVAFNAPTGVVLPPVDTDNAVVVMRVAEHRAPDEAEFAAQKAQLQDEMLRERRNNFFSAFMVKAKQRMKIEVNRENMQRVIG
jgi:peptidyl-prolyl cis-trans isomerase D